jgi:hypothetical protein
MKIGLDMALADDMSASVVATVHDAVISSWGPLVGRDFQEYEKRIMTAMKDSMTKGNGYWVQGVTTGRRMGGKSMVQQMQAAGQMQGWSPGPKEVVWGHADTLEEAVEKRSDKWMLPERVMRHKDGNLPLGGVYEWDDKRGCHVLTIHCWEWPKSPQSTNLKALATSFHAGSKVTSLSPTPKAQKRNILTWTLPGDTPGDAVVNAFTGVADVLSLHNGMPCFIVASHGRTFRRLRLGKLPVKGKRWRDHG